MRSENDIGGILTEGCGAEIQELWQALDSGDGPMATSVEIDSETASKNSQPRLLRLILWKYLLNCDGICPSKLRNADVVIIGSSDQHFNMRKPRRLNRHANGWFGALAKKVENISSSVLEENLQFVNKRQEL